MGRAPCCDKANVKRGPWSPEEDATLKDYLHKHGTAGNWISLPQRAGLKRCGKSCRLRWLNYLRPDIKHGAFSEEEDNIIISLYYKLGSRWSVIAANLQGRTDNDVKNHWNTKLKKKLFGGSNNNNTNTFNKFNSSSKFHVPFTYTNIINNTNNVTNPTIFQPHQPLSSTPNSPKPSYVDNNNTNYTFNHVNYWPSFSTLLAQCNSNTTISSTNYPMSLLPNFTLEDNPFTNDPTRNPDCYYIEEGSSASSSSSVVYGSSLEDDPFFAELGGFGSNQQVMVNPTCGYNGDQEDIKPQGLGQSVIN